MSAIKKGEATNFVWDIPSGEQYTSVGRNVTITRNRGAEQTTLPTDDGETDGVVLYDLNEDVTIEAILKTDGLPNNFDPGTVLSIGAAGNQKSFLVQNFSRRWVRKDWAKVTITAKAWDAMTLTAGSGTT